MCICGLVMGSVGVWAGGWEGGVRETGPTRLPTSGRPRPTVATHTAPASPVVWTGAINSLECMKASPGGQVHQSVKDGGREMTERRDRTWRW